MPEYYYQSPDTQEIKSVFQGMKDEHVYTENGVTWNRLYTIPQAASNSKLDPFSTNQFIEKTGKQKGKYRDLIERSQELSDQRRQITGGEDPVQRGYFNDYEKKTGKKHLKDRPTVIETKHLKVDFTPQKRKRR
jgi:hypothetical protein